MTDDARRGATAIWGRASRGERLVILGGLGLVAVYILGVALRIIGGETGWLIAAVLGGYAAGILAMAPDRRDVWPVPVPNLLLAGTLAAAAITALEAIELLGDLDDALADVPYLLVVVAAAAAGAVAAWGAWSLHGRSPLAQARATLVGGGDASRLALVGALGVLLGQVLMVTVGVFNVGIETALLTAAVVAATVTLLTAGLSGWRVRAAWVAGGWAALAAVMGLTISMEVFGEAADRGYGLDLLWPFVLVVAGLVVHVVGVALPLVAARRAG